MRSMEDIIEDNEFFDGGDFAYTIDCGHKIQLTKALKDEGYIHKSEKKEVENQLNAWFDAFGTTQLTHALCRLETAEKNIHKSDVQEVLDIRIKFKGTDMIKCQYPFSVQQSNEMYQAIKTCAERINKTKMQEKPRHSDEKLNAIIEKIKKS